MNCQGRVLETNFRGLTLKELYDSYFAESPEWDAARK